MDELKKFVFDAILLADTFEKLKESGISVRLEADTSAISRLEERSFSPRITFNARRMASVYVAFFCLENAVRELIA